jgi:hypothetical protein
MPHRPRSVDQTRSLVGLSRKREYFKHPPETTGIFASELRDFGVWRQASNYKDPQLAGVYAIYSLTISSCRTAWLTSQDSNFDIPTSKNAFEMSEEFPPIRSEIRPGDFCI